MNNTKIANELIKLAKSLIAADQEGTNEEAWASEYLKKHGWKVSGNTATKQIENNIKLTIDISPDKYFGPDAVEIDFSNSHFKNIKELEEKINDIHHNLSFLDLR